MYTITNEVFNCYIQLGRFKSITPEVLEKRLTANVEVATIREKIFEGQNKWIYKLGNCEIKVDHDTDIIYQVKWVDKPSMINAKIGRLIESTYVKYGLNKKGTRIAAISQ